MNSFGQIFRVTIYGESHGSGVGIIVDGMPSGIKLTLDDFVNDINRRKPGAIGTTSRIEADEVNILSGVFNDYTTGMPINLYFLNQNTKSSDYSYIKNTPRPSHADFTASKKYNGFEDYRGGGHFSGRLTLPIVAAGVLAKKIISANITSEIVNIHGATAKESFNDEIMKAANSFDSVGGIVKITISNMPIGVGEPYFDSIESVLAHLLYSVGGVKGVSFGIGFEGASLYGSEFNDCIIDEFGKTKTNNNGGINGGISNGNDIIINVFVKPTPSIFKSQKTYNFEKKEIDDLVIKGRHDAAIVLRAPVVLEAMCAIGLADLFLLSKKEVI